VHTASDTDRQTIQYFVSQLHTQFIFNIGNVKLIWNIHIGTLLVINFKGNLQLLIPPPQMNTDVCEHYWWRICSYFWDKLMRNLTLLHEIVVCMKTANCQTGFHNMYTITTNFVLHMLECWLHVLPRTWFNRKV